MDERDGLAFLLDEPFGALLFDCDGTLVDTVPAHFLALNEALRAQALAMDEGWYRKRVGLTPGDLFREFEQERGVVLDVAAITDRYGPMFRGKLHRAAEITAVADVARRFYGRVPMAVVSNGQLKNVVETLTAKGLLGLFDTVVSAEEVPRGKPAPDVYLEAARRLGVAAEECVVFEDSEEGLEAGRRAGMQVRDVRVVVGV